MANLWPGQAGNKRRKPTDWKQPFPRQEGMRVPK